MVNCSTIHNTGRACATYLAVEADCVCGHPIRADANIKSKRPTPRMKRDQDENQHLTFYRDCTRLGFRVACVNMVGLNHCQLPYEGPGAAMKEDVIS